MTISQYTSQNTYLTGYDEQEGLSDLMMAGATGSIISVEVTWREGAKGISTTEPEREKGLDSNIPTSYSMRSC